MTGAAPAARRPLSRLLALPHGVALGGLVIAGIVLYLASFAFNTPNGPESFFGTLMVAVAGIVLFARLLGALVARVGQPRVMGEVVAGILLGPTLVGALPHLLPGVFGAEAAALKTWPFPKEVLDAIRGGADIGLAFYMFLVGLELDPTLLKGRFSRAAVISGSSVVLPFTLGVVTAVAIFRPDPQLTGVNGRLIPFAIFMGAAMSITAFPVLARILIERRMIKRPVGAISIASAAVDDVIAWGLIALASAAAVVGGTVQDALEIVLLASAFSAAMFLFGRPLLSRVSQAYDEAGQIPVAWIITIFLGVLISAYLAQRVGIAAIFGAFVMGVIMPRRSDLGHDLARRIEDFVVTLLLPLFFVVSGLKVNLGALVSRPELWLLTLLLIAVAIVGKWVGAMLAARFVGHTWRESSAIGALMNTRGLTELIVINIGLDLGVIGPDVGAMLVVMALVTTFMAGPALKLIDPRGEFSAPVEEELQSAHRATEAEVQRPVPERSILIAAMTERNEDGLLALGEALATTEPPHELIVARLVAPQRIATGLAAEERELNRATLNVNRRRDALIRQHIAARAVAFTSPDVGGDLVRLASQEEVDLLLIDGRRPLLGEGVPGGPVGHVLQHAPCDVAVLVERETVPQIGPDGPVVVPFGGAEHDWAALELGAWIASERSAPLRLLGARGAEGERDASRLIASASLVVQQLAGIPAEPLLAEPGREALLAAAQGAGIVVVGLSDDWRQEGLGPVRSALAASAPAPILFVRRGVRAGALAPRGDMTRFAWSSTGSAAAGATT